MLGRRAAQAAKVEEIRGELAAKLPPDVLDRFDVMVQPLGNGLTRVQIRAKVITGRTGGRAVIDS